MEFNMEENTIIEIDIIDISGSVVKKLYNGRASQGENVFSFNKSNLSTGIYFLVIKSSSKIIKNEKIIISN